MPTLTRFSALGGCIALASACLAAVEDSDQPWWSLRPLSASAVPLLDAQESAWARTPVDRFVWQKLKEKGLAPAPEADRRTLARRLYFDLIGLPPTPAEIDAFATDASADAYERLVDRLLASPHYGERWARHWMDAVHFAETHGHDQDRVRPNAWRFRDYLIGSFNADTPYARFVQEQLAADVLFADTPALIPALGFLAAGPWDESSLRDIREDSTDRQIGYYLDRDDMVTTVASTFLGLTVHCARCHDHKFDPIPQEDYYRLQAVFAGVGRGDVAYDRDLAVGRRRRELRTTLAGIEEHSPEVLARLGEADFRRGLADWEARHRGEAVAWAPLEVVRVASANGADLKPLPDGSIRSEGARPDRDVYTVTARCREGEVAAVRLEVLADEGLPKSGPGRQENGNFHLSEFQVVTAGPDDQPCLAEFLPPVSDYDQPGWTVRHAVDGDPTTAWGIYPHVGRSHQAVFPLKEPLPRGSDMTVRLEQQHGDGHLIGRFRLTATASKLPARVPVLPDAVAAGLAKPAERRTPSEWEQLGLHYLRERTAAGLAALPAPEVVYAAAADFAPDGGHKPVRRPRPVHVLKRGDINKPGKPVKPGAPACVGAGGEFDGAPDPAEGERRSALARWLTRPDNPLLWRVAVNRVWHYHFGRGIVETPNDFGHMGGTPTHPELLDGLAAWFRDEAGGSIKRLHRLLVTSAVYRQASRSDTASATADADNRYLWRMPRARLDAEELRDAVLTVSGRLDRRAGGPSDRQFAMRPGVHVTPVVEYNRFDWDRPVGHRRSVYRFIFRTLPDPFVDCMDGADASQLTPVRSTSVTAPQALALFNDDFILAHSEAFARRLRSEFADAPSQVREACRWVWGRPPTGEELAELTAHAERRGLASVCRLLFNSNEFLFLD
jgi:hypothetical protein